MTNELLRSPCVLIVIWALVFAIEAPLRQAFINGVIPSEQRATVLSFDNLMGSAGGVIAQPALGRVADVNGYGASYLVAAAISRRCPCRSSSWPAARRRVPTRSPTTPTSR